MQPSAALLDDGHGMKNPQKLTLTIGVNLWGLKQQQRYFNCYLELLEELTG